jgi:hypothetical protein
VSKSAYGARTSPLLVAAALLAPLGGSGLRYFRFTVDDARGVAVFER